MSLTNTRIVTYIEATAICIVECTCAVIARWAICIACKTSTPTAKGCPAGIAPATKSSKTVGRCIAVIGIHPWIVVVYRIPGIVYIRIVKPTIEEGVPTRVITP
jgi:hypothetical protein